MRRFRILARSASKEKYPNSAADRSAVPRSNGWPAPTLLAAVMGASILAVSASADDAMPAPAAQPPRLPFTISRETTRITEPLRADGTPDYAAALEAAASAGVTPENNAAVLYIKAFGPSVIPEEGREEFFRKLGIDPLPERGNYFISYAAQLESVARDAGPARTEADKERLAERFNEELERAWSGPWSAEQNPLVAAWLERNEKPLELVVAGTKRPRWYVPLVLDLPPLIMNIDPISYELRDAARLLTARAMLRLGAGKLAAAEADLLACHRLARHLFMDHFFVGRVTGYVIETIACEGDLAVATSGKLSVEQSLAYRAALEKLPLLPATDRLFDRGERFWSLSTAVYVALAVEKGDTDTFEDIVNLKFPAVGVDWDSALREINRRVDEAVGAARAPTRAERRTRIAKASADLEQDAKQPLLAFGQLLAGRSLRRQAGDAVADALLPSFGRIQGAIFDSQDRVTMRLDLVRLAFALAAYRADRGRYPPELDKLAPKYIATVPGDLFSGQPLIYRPTGDGGGYLLYSIGKNETDDGGRTYGSQPEGDDLVIRTPKPERKP